MYLGFISNDQELGKGPIPAYSWNVSQGFSFFVMTHNTLISSVYNSVFHLHQYSKIIRIEISYLLHTPLTAECGLHVCGSH